MQNALNRTWRKWKIIIKYVIRSTLRGNQKSYKIYELVNQILIESIKENSNLNKELSTILEKTSQEKRKVDEMLSKVMQRLKDTNLNFHESNKNFSNLITSEIQEYINFSNSSKVKINYIERFLSEKLSRDNKFVYNEEEYIQYTTIRRTNMYDSKKSPAIRWKIEWSN